MLLPKLTYTVFILLSIIIYSSCESDASIQPLPPEPAPKDSLSMPMDSLSIRVELPEKIYAVVGDELQLFFRGIVGAVNPYNYDILVTCPVGKKFTRYFTFTPSALDIGTYPFSITLRDDNGRKVGYAESIIEVVEETDDAVLNILIFGDSLTSNGIWCHHANNRLTCSANFCGPQETDGTHYFGQGGWKWESYTTASIPALRFEIETQEPISVGSIYEDESGNNYTVLEVNVTGTIGSILTSSKRYDCLPGSPNGYLSKVNGTGAQTIHYTDFHSDVANPLWVDNHLTFQPYISKYVSGKPDILYVLLGWNDIKPWQTDFSDIEEHIRVFCTTLHHEYPAAKIRLMGLQIPSINGGIGNNYGATGSGYADNYGLCHTVLNLNRFYQDLSCKIGDYVGFINISCQFDSEYNMPSQEYPVNSYNPTTETIGTNGVHPNIYGYYQIGDAVYRDICGLSYKTK